MPVEWSDSVVVAHLAEGPAFEDEMDELTRRLELQPRHAVLDFIAVRFLNSSNLAHLVALHKQLAVHNRRVLLCNVSDTLWPAFTLSRLDRLFERYANVPIALAAVQLGLTAVRRPE